MVLHRAVLQGAFPLKCYTWPESNRLSPCPLISAVPPPCTWERGSLLNWGSSFASQGWFTQSTPCAYVHLSHVTFELSLSGAPVSIEGFEPSQHMCYSVLNTARLPFRHMDIKCMRINRNKGILRDLNPHVLVGSQLIFH